MRLLEFLKLLTLFPDLLLLFFDVFPGTLNLFLHLDILFVIVPLMVTLLCAQVTDFILDIFVLSLLLLQ